MLLLYEEGKEDKKNDELYKYDNPNPKYGSAAIKSTNYFSTTKFFPTTYW
jgi:hypothetical protein